VRKPKEILGTMNCTFCGEVATIKRGAKNYGAKLYYHCPSCGVNPSKSASAQLILEEALNGGQPMPEEKEPEITEEPTPEPIPEPQPTPEPTPEEKPELQPEPESHPEPTPEPKPKSGWNPFVFEDI
jgi:hypothetical protein